MSGNEGNDEPDEQPSRKERPSLPSIQSLFGISREDDLDTLLQIESPGGRSASDYDARRSSRTPPGAHPKAPPRLPLHRAPSSRPPPSAYPPGDLHSFLAGPSGAQARRRSSGSSLDHPGPSHASAHQLSDTSLSPLSPPESPESEYSSRHDPRLGAGRGYSPLQGVGSAGSSYLPERPRRSSSRGWNPLDRPAELPRPTSASSTKGSSESPSTSTFVHRRPSVVDHTRAASPYNRIPTVSDSLKRRHTISNERRESISDQSTVGSSSRPSSRPHTASSRRTLQPPYSTLPSPWSNTPDRPLPPLTRPPQSESQRSSSRLQPSSHLAPLSFPSPAMPARPATSPSPFQQSHPPSSFPRRLSAAAAVGPRPSRHGPSPPPLGLSSSSTLLPPHSSYDGPRRPYSAESSIEYTSRDDDAAHPPPFGTVESSRPAATSGGPSGGAKYECPYCQKRFNRPSSLKIHVNTHTGEKPFQCPFPGCGRRFSVMSNMRRHSRVHSQPRHNDNENLADGDLDAEGEPEAEGDSSGMEHIEQHRPQLAVLPASSSSGPSAGTMSTLRGSSSTSRRSSQQGPSRAPPSTHSSGAQVSAGSVPRAIQPAPPRPLPMPLLVPAAPESLSAGAHRLYEESHRRVSTRVTRATAKRSLPEDSSLSGRPSHKRSRSNDDDEGDHKT